MLCGVPSNEIDFVWPLVAPLIEAAAKRPGATMEALDVQRLCKANDMQLWLYWANDRVKAVAVTQIIKHPRFSSANLVIGTGYDRADWEHCIKRIEEWAEANGCERMRLETRPGWERVFKEHGYHKTHVILEKEI